MEVFILVGDSHMLPLGKQWVGQDPSQRLTSVVSAIVEDHGGAAAAFFLGDTAFSGRQDEYRTFKLIVDALPFQYHLVLGNHDEREVMIDVFGQSVGTWMKGFWQYYVDLAQTRIIVADTVAADGAHGEVCEDRIAWLEAAISSSARPVVLLMHHSPLKIHYNIDRSMLQDSERLAAMIVAHQRKIRLIGFGHVHRHICGSWLGIPIVSLRSTAHQLPLIGWDGRPADHGVPWYGAVYVGSDSVVVQLRDVVGDRRP